MSANTQSQGGRGLLRRILYNREIRSVITQIAVILLVFVLIFEIGTNLLANLAAIGKEISFDFISLPASYDITFQPFVDYDPSKSHFWAAMVGLSNTLLVAVSGIILATILGFTLGVMRLSNNFLISRISQVFIEFNRNVPVLLHILFLYGVIIHILPKPKQSISILDTAFISNRGMYVPKPLLSDGAGIVFLSVFVAIGAIFALSRWARIRQRETGQIFPVFWSSVVLFFIIPTLTFFAMGSPISLEFPVLKGFNFKGGVSLKPEYLALWLALSYYTACFIAEIVRGGILAIHKGQREAAYALGLTPNRTLQLAIIPQALPLIIPPLTSNYLNLTKNSSLAVAIGYFDIVATIGTISLMQTGKEVETMVIVLSIYLCLSLIISGAMNLLNYRLKIKVR
ncbi:MAG: ABC transporter permease subunit [Pseudomonadota bacterium]|nr:ABC transporter permease subunit [Pseudomonadota bacterium]|tara:strand:- start:682 stop:1878 length:1197 start_codon:yes stop_codon:yes gene_type:complete